MSNFTPKKSKAYMRPKRMTYGFARAGGILGKQIRSATEKRGFVETRLLTHWREFVGAEFAKIAQPVKVHYPRQGLGATLTILVSGANAPMMQMQLPDLIKRVNSCYGYAAINRINITQTAAYGFGQEQSDDDQPTAKTLSPQASQDVDRAVEDVSNSDLKAALANLGKNIKRKQKA